MNTMNRPEARRCQCGHVYLEHAWFGDGRMFCLNPECNCLDFDNEEWMLEAAEEVEPEDTTTGEIA